jgi:hypothetical protein
MISQLRVDNDFGKDDDNEMAPDNGDHNDNLKKAGTVKSSLTTLIPLKVYKRIIDLKPSFLLKKKLSLPEKIEILSSSYSIISKEALKNDCLQTEIAFLNDRRKKKGGDVQKLLYHFQSLKETDNVEENDFKALMAFASKYIQFKGKYVFVKRTSNSFVIITL